MKKFITLLMLFISINALASTQDLEKILTEIQAAESKKLPQTALELAQVLEKKAKEEKNKGLYIRAISKRVLNQCHILGKAPKDKIKILKDEIEKIDNDSKPLVKIILARWFWHYYEQNQYKFSGRTQTSGMDNDDFTTWDLPKIFREIRVLFEDALKSSEKLKKIKIEEYQGIVERGNLFKGSPVTLYEFAIRETIQFLTLGISSLPSPQDKFEIETSSGSFGSSKDFLSYKPNTTDKESPLLKEIELYQELLKFYQKEKLTEQFIDTEINRLKFINSQVSGSDKTEIFFKRLKEIENDFSKYPTSTLASFEIASLYSNDGEYMNAVKTCESAISKHPESDEATLCQNLIQTIKQPQFSIKTESSINKSNSIFYLKYKNIKKLYIRIVQDNWENYITRKWYRFSDGLDQNDVKRLLNSKPEKEWAVDLEETKDYKERRIEKEIQEVPYGFYRIFISSSPEFSTSRNYNTNEQLVYTSFWQTDTMFIVKSEANKIKGFILDSRNGTPLEKKNIIIYGRNNKKEGVYEKIKEIKTNRDGDFEFNPHDAENNWDLYFNTLSSQTGNTLYTQWLSQHYQNEKQNNKAALIFTDRAIYRPGQRIFYKVICYSYDQRNEKYEVYKCKDVRLKLFDSNEKEVQASSNSSNDFGSFSGNFIAPKNVLTGQMSLRTEQPYGNSVIQVEEYKRPKFEVTLDQPNKQYRLDENVTITGKASSYSGAPLTSAKVKFRIIRGIELPWWWHWRNPYAAEQEISHGTIATNEKGEFNIEFKAKPNKAIEAKIKPNFRFRIEVDVVDSTGETRSSNTAINVGYVSMKAKMQIPDWLPEKSEIKINISTKTLDDKPQNANGDVEIYELNGPKVPRRSPSNQQYYVERYWTAYLKGEIIDTTKDLSDIRNWDLGKSAQKSKFSTKDGTADVNFKLKEGAYCAILKTKDQWGNELEEKNYFIVFAQDSKNLLGLSTTKKDFSIKIPSFFKIQNINLVVGDKLEAIWATGYNNAQIQVSFIQHDKVFKSYWTNTGESFHSISYPITENLKGGFTVQITFVHENQVYFHNQFINVDRPEKQLKIIVEKMKSKLRPGEKDTWSLKILGDKAQKVAAELVATMYDASLDIFSNHSFPSFEGYWRDTQASEYSSTLVMKDFLTYSTWNFPYKSSQRHYPQFTYDITSQFSYLWPYLGLYQRGLFGGGAMLDGDMPKSMSIMAKSDANFSETMAAPSAEKASERSGIQAEKSILDATQKGSQKTPEVTIRKNLTETAFFFPQLLTDEKGNVKIEFTMPDALTKWKFMALAHGKKTELGTITKEIVTQKELMVTPNPPRFLRQGDQLIFSAKVDNLSDNEQKGKIILELQDALKEINVDKDFLKDKPEFKFTIASKKSSVFSWTLRVPDVTYPLLYRVKAIGEKFSDGEEGLIPIISRRIFVQESIPLWISGKGNKVFNFEKLINSEKSTTLQNEKLVLQMVSNPAWYAVQAIPYLKKYFPECTDYVFERFYANSLGEKIVETNPKIEKIFSQWKGTQALKSAMQKNQDLKGVSLEETPWVNDADNEEKAKEDVGLFFEKNNLRQELTESYKELEARMLPQGGWPWFPGGQIDYPTTLYIITGFGKLRQLGIKVNLDLALKSIEKLDDWIKENYDIIQHKELNHYTHMIAYYLYGRSYFLKDAPISPKHQEAVDYFLDQANKYWPELDSRLSEANTAIATYRFGKRNVTQAIVKSLRERAIHKEELGMFWADEEWGYWWYRAPIETQSRIIELFKEAIPKSEKEIDEMNIWVLKQKQTQDWKTSRATADVIYTLLYGGADLLKSDKLVTVSLGDKKIEPKNVEAGTGFYEKRFSKQEIKAQMGHVKIEKSDKGVAWGGIHWQYFDDISKITVHKTPLSLVKKLWVKRNTKKGPTIYPIDNNEKEKLTTGDTLVVRIELRTDRDMEYVHMKDMRGSGTEPINVLSHWKYQDGLAYYESTRDTATHFFFPYLPKGTFVFEYELKIFHKGEYQTGMSEIQCLYAPEFSSHSESFKLKVE